jgi:hypothetical protein
MKYFLVKQDHNIAYSPQAADVVNKIDFRYLTPESAYKIDDRILVEISGSEFTVFPDLIVYPRFLVTQEAQKILVLYEPRMLFKQVFFTNLKYKQRQLYFMPILKTSTENIRDCSIFCVPDTCETTIVMRLDLAESLLIRGMRGFILEEIEPEVMRRLNDGYKQ